MLNAQVEKARGDLVNETALNAVMTNAGNQDPFWGKQFSSLYGFCKSAIIGLWAQVVSQHKLILLISAKKFPQLPLTGTTKFCDPLWALMMQCTLFASWRV